MSVATLTPGGGDHDGIRVLRCPSARALRLEAKRADIVLINNMSLQLLWPIFDLGKKVVIVHHTWIEGTNFRGVLKRLALRHFHNLAVSDALAKALPVRSTRINNPFQSQLFSKYRNYEKDRDIVFVGRLDRSKGCHVLLAAIKLLCNTGLLPTVTIIGAGPEQDSLSELAANLGVTQLITFVGNMNEERAQLVSRHRIMVVPSVWSEPFGIVALEGIAAGCALIVSVNGGLPEAIGECGLTFENGNEFELASLLSILLKDPLARANLQRNASNHLRKHEPLNVAASFLEIFNSLRR